VQRSGSFCGLPALVGSRTLPARTSSNKSDELSISEDPEAQLRRYGKDFGRGGYTFDTTKWFGSVPRVKARTCKQRNMEELVELAVLNERLAGELQPWEARNRLEYLRLYRKNWEAIYDYITETEVTATLAVIEEANRKAGGVSF
jgi:chlorophyllide a oxygenase